MTQSNISIIKLIILTVLLFSCQNTTKNDMSRALYTSYSFSGIAEDDSIMGSILIYDLKNNHYYSNDFGWAKVGKLPASTFKIPHSLIALDLGIVKNKNTILKWDGKKRDYKMWQQDLTFKQAFHYSCVPCYQEIAQKVGEKRMNEFVQRFNYGNIDINADNIDNFWLIGNSEISQFEQIDFLKRLYLSKLPVSKKTEQIFKELFIVKQDDDYTLRAKTGLSITNKNYNGWYVGYVEKRDNVYFFATNISPQDKYYKTFNKKRKELTIEALKQLLVLPQ